MILSLIIPALSTRGLFRLLVCWIVLVSPCVVKNTEDDKEIVTTRVQVAVGDVAPRNGVFFAA